MSDNKFVLVPVEPTYKMLGGAGLHGSELNRRREIYRKMIASAPQAAPMPDRCPDCNLIDWRDFYTGAKKTHEVCASCGHRRAALSAAPVSEQPQEASTAQPDERDEFDILLLARQSGLFTLVDVQSPSKQERLTKFVELLITAQPADKPECKAEQPKCPLCDGHGTAPVWEKSEQQADPAFAGRVFVDQLTGKRDVQLSAEGKLLQDMTRLYADPPAQPHGLTDDAKHIGSLMANVMFNFAQRVGHTINSDDSLAFNSLRKQWDDALLAAQGGGK
jgi:hypothetical protein